MQAVEVVFSVLIGSELSSQVVIGLVFRVLEIVFSVGRCLPDINDCIWNWLLGDQIGNSSVHQSSFSTFWYWVLHDATAKWSEWGVGAPEWTENRGGCGGLARFGHDIVCNLIDNTSNIVRNDCGVIDLGYSRFEAENI